MEGAKGELKVDVGREVKQEKMVMRWRVEVAMSAAVFALQERTANPPLNFTKLTPRT